MYKDRQPLSRCQVLWDFFVQNYKGPHMADVGASFETIGVSLRARYEQLVLLELVRYLDLRSVSNEMAIEKMYAYMEEHALLSDVGVIADIDALAEHLSAKGVDVNNVSMLEREMVLEGKFDAMLGTNSLRGGFSPFFNAQTAFRDGAPHMTEEELARADIRFGDAIDGPGPGFWD